MDGVSPEGDSGLLRVRVTLVLHVRAGCQLPPHTLPRSQHRRRPFSLTPLVRLQGYLAHKKTPTPLRPCSKLQNHCSKFIVHCSILSVQCSGVSVQGSAFSVQCSVFSVQCSVFSVQGLGFRVQGSGCRVQGARFRVEG